MKTTSCLISLFLFCLLFSCNNNKIQNDQIIGEWKCIDILTDTIEERNPNEIVFEFKADSSYTYQIAKEYDEAGKWYLSKDKLVTYTDDLPEVAVRVGLYGTDTLRFYQIRENKSEVWTMLRQ